MIPVAEPSNGAGTRAVDVRGLVKSYAGTQVVRGIDLAIRHGEVFALLGPNGAGKSTTVEILEGYRSRDRGEVSVLGVDPGRQRAKLKRRIGIVLQSPGIDRYLTVRKAIAMYATFYPHPRPVDDVLVVAAWGGCWAPLRHPPLPLGTTNRLTPLTARHRVTGDVSCPRGHASFEPIATHTRTDRRTDAYQTDHRQSSRG